MKNFNPTQVFDLRRQLDHITHKPIQLFEECRIDPDNARRFVLLIRNNENKMVSHGNKIAEIQVIKIDKTQFKRILILKNFER